MIRKIKSYLVYSLCALIFILLMSNPGESSFLSEISLEYSKYHAGQTIPSEVIGRIGRSERINYLLFSTYAYQYDGMSFYYLGVANKVFFIESIHEKRQKKPMKVV